MNLHDIRKEAAERQAAVHLQRSFHRDEHKRCEREDHTLQAIIKRIDKTLQEQAEIAQQYAEVKAARISTDVEQLATTAEASEPEDAPEQSEPTADVVMESPSELPSLPLSDDAILAVMRSNVNAEGVCLLRPSQIAKEAGLSVGTLNLTALRRLVASGQIKNLGAGRYLVHASVPHADKAQPVQPIIEVTPAAERHSFADLAPAAEGKANRILAAFQKERTGSIASVEREKLYRLAGSAYSLKRMIQVLETEGLFREVKARGAEGKDFVTVLFRTVEAEAAE